MADKDKDKDKESGSQTEIEKLKAENFKHREERRLAKDEMKRLNAMQVEFDALKASQLSDAEKAAAELVTLNTQVAETKLALEVSKRNAAAQSAAVANNVPLDILPSLNVAELDFENDEAVGAFFAPFANADATPPASTVKNPPKTTDDGGELDWQNLTSEQVEAMNTAERDKKSKAW